MTFYPTNRSYLEKPIIGLSKVTSDLSNFRTYKYNREIKRNMLLQLALKKLLSKPFTLKKTKDL